MMVMKVMNAKMIHMVMEVMMEVVVQRWRGRGPWKWRCDTGNSHRGETGPRNRPARATGGEESLPWRAGRCEEVLLAALVAEAAADAAAVAAARVEVMAGGREAAATSQMEAGTRRRRGEERTERRKSRSWRNTRRRRRRPESRSRRKNRSWRNKRRRRRREEMRSKRRKRRSKGKRKRVARRSSRMRALDHWDSRTAESPPRSAWPLRAGAGRRRG